MYLSLFLQFGVSSIHSCARFLDEFSADLSHIKRHEAFEEPTEHIKPSKMFIPLETWSKIHKLSYFWLSFRLKLI